MADFLMVPVHMAAMIWQEMCGNGPVATTTIKKMHLFCAADRRSTIVSSAGVLAASATSRVPVV
ncbi:MAG: hypothetical protein MRK02_13095 [Candidatus Scalindua sp.]|nr:hypothetical protein [Candidatus Scalindua sp.]